MPNRIENQTFEDQTVRLDGNQYSQCKFRRCVLQYGGSEIPELENCEFHECSWSFTEAAARTVQFMTALYHGAGQGGRELIEQTFENIRQRRPNPIVH
jgi:hypothetical protein